jgi:hypothetical protein
MMCIPRRALAGALVAVSAALAACGDPNEPIAQFENTTDTLDVYSFNGTPSTAPVGLLIAHPNTLEPSAERLTPSFLFDVAFDFDDAGKTFAFPVKLVASNLSPAYRQVGIQRLTFPGSPDPFEMVTRAPTSGYSYDLPFEIAVGDVLVIQSSSAPACSNIGLGGVYSTIYAKVQVLELDVPNRRVRLGVLTNPNCAFRGLQPGRPTE